jgi:ABC-type transporter Mla subunit MlaD
MSDRSDFAAGIASVSPREDAPGRASSEHTTPAAQGSNQTRGALEEVEDVKGHNATVDQAGDELGRNLKTAAEHINRLADEQKAAGAERLSGVAHVIAGAARDLKPELPRAAKPLHDAAAALERASTALKERSAAELIDGVGKFARAQPVAFFGSAVVAGLVLARFLKSSAGPARPSTSR